MKKRFGVELLEDIPRKIRIFLFVLGGFFLASIFLFMLVEQTSFWSAFRHTLETLAFSYEPTNDYAKFAQMSMVIIGAIVVWWALWSLLDIAMSDGFWEYLLLKQEEKKVASMKHHYIIAGGGRVGEEVAHRLLKRSVPHVLIEIDAKKAKDLRKLKHPIVLGDATDAETLTKANIAQARGVILTLPQAEKNLLVALLAKEQNPQIQIHARADTPDYVSVLKKAGATSVVVPEVAAADHIVASLTFK
ncbi:MAG TPA: NAD(P)-binding protein [Acidobacteriota bacterium]|nr:NAD(P)-binding protein [Acidobacteriota bacterium]